MSEKCKICLNIFESPPELLAHFLDEHLSKLKVIPCLFCEKKLGNFEDLMHHIKLDHQGMANDLLQNGTIARQTKKQLGDYLDLDKKSVGLECPHCFELFSKLEKLDEHTKKEHDLEIRPEFIAKMREKIETPNEDPPICQRCNKAYPGVVFTKINKKVMNVCFNCYEDYFGANALARLTIGTNEDMIKKMRVPIEK